MYRLSKSLDIKLSSNEAEAEDFDELAAERVRDNQSILGKLNSPANQIDGHRPYCPLCSSLGNGELLRN